MRTQRFVRTLRFVEKWRTKRRSRKRRATERKGRGARGGAPPPEEIQMIQLLGAEERRTWSSTRACWSLCEQNLRLRREQSVQFLLLLSIIHDWSCSVPAAVLHNWDWSRGVLAIFLLGSSTKFQPGSREKIHDFHRTICNSQFHRRSSRKESMHDLLRH